MTKLVCGEVLGNTDPCLCGEPHDAVRVLLIGESPVMRQLRALVRRVGRSALPVFVRGQTGVGKELVARALHAVSGRAGRMVAFNVCAVSDGMFEDALFGHVRGAFTGAVSDSPGYLMEADRGTLFLDEIGGLALASQAKLLRVLETREFRPVGARLDRRSDFRLVTATNEPIEQRVQCGTFRQDLYFRLRGMAVDVPSLAARRSDIPLLAEHFRRGALAHGGASTGFTSGSLEWLGAQAWPGNVRQLRTVVECAVACGDGGSVTRSNLVRSYGVDRNDASAFSEPSAIDPTLVAGLESVGWDVAALADRLGVHRATVYRRMAKHGLTSRRGESALRMR